MRNFLAAIVFACALCGYAWVQTQPASAGLNISPVKIDFGQRTIKSESQPVTVTLCNQTQGPIAIQEILASGIDFPSRNNCGQQLASGSECAVQVSFKPAIAGNRTGILQITSSDSSNSHFIPLTGIGNAQ